MSVVGGLVGSYFGPVGSAVGSMVGGALEGGSDGTGSVSSGYDAAGLQLSAGERAATNEFTPFKEFGADRLAGAKKATTALDALFANPSSIVGLPGYKFRKAQGEESVQNSAAARGNLFSGRTLMELTKFGQDYASSEYDKEIARQEGHLNMEMGGIGVGERAATARSSIFTGMSENLASIYAGKGRDVGSIESASAARKDKFNQGIIGTVFNNALQNKNFETYYGGGSANHAGAGGGSFMGDISE